MIRMNGGIEIILLVLFCAILASLGQLLFKLGSETFEFSFFSILRNFKVILGAALYATSALLFVYALKHGELSVLYPIIATSYIWVLVLSNVFLNETLTFSKATGVLLIVFGVIMITRGGV